MAQHGYLHENYDSDGFARGDERDVGDRGYDRRRRERDFAWSHRPGDAMFGWDDEDRLQRPLGNNERFIEGNRHQPSGCFSGREDHGARDDYGQRRSRYSAHPDDHYLSWREKQMKVLDSDYEDYCREREQQFRSDFESWRQNRQRRSAADQEVMELDNPAIERSEILDATTSLMGAATLGTNSSENDAGAISTTGRRRR